MVVLSVEIVTEVLDYDNAHGTKVIEQYYDEVLHKYDPDVNKYIPNFDNAIYRLFVKECLVQSFEYNVRRVIVSTYFEDARAVKNPRIFKHLFWQGCCELVRYLTDCSHGYIRFNNHTEKVFLTHGNYKRKHSHNRCAKLHGA